MNKMLQATLLVVVFSLSFVATTLLLQGCGGGGVAVGGDNANPTTFGGAAADFAAGRHWRVLSSVDQLFPGNTRGRSRQSGGCPREQWGGGWWTWDFGDGCYSSLFGEEVRGRISVRYDEGGSNDVSSFECRFDAFGTPEETITGTMSLRNIGREDAFGLSYDLTLRSECAEREKFDGTVVYSAGWFSDRFRITGKGNYTAPAVGTVSFDLRDVEYEFPGCDYPIAGQMTVSAGGRTSTVAFLSDCGTARVNIEGVQEDINLDNVQFNACR